MVPGCRLEKKTQMSNANHCLPSSEYQRQMFKHVGPFNRSLELGTTEEKRVALVKCVGADFGH